MCITFQFAAHQNSTSNENLWLQRFALTLQNVKQKAVLYNYNGNFFYWLNKKPNHIHVHGFLVQILRTAVIGFLVWASRVPVLQGQRKPM